jgi:AraC family transcriptional regulator of adaptative response / DNA-3-methyladenine glycosylase II
MIGRMEHPKALDDDAAYLVLKARDERFDGRLFVGVTSTGVYCRPVCRVRLPQRKNCRFFSTRAQAEAAAFRPCMKCRPEIAPGLSAMDSSRALADSAARSIETAVFKGQGMDMPTLAARLGVTDRHLRRIFQATHGVSPHQYLDTQRLLLAKQLLTDTTQPITQIALASGFDSLRRFNAAFVQRYRFNPTQLRRDAGAKPEQTRLRLAYRPPYDIEAMLCYLKRRAISGVEEVQGLGWRRTVRWPAEAGSEPVTGWFSVQFVPDKNEVQLNVSDTLAPHVGALMQTLRQGLDLDADPARIDPVLALLPVPPRPGTRLPGAVDGFEGAVRVILGQQVTVKAACTLAQRLVERFGQPIETPFATLTHLFPSAKDMADADPQDIGKLGIVRQRVGALQALARAVATGQIELQPGAPLATTMDALRALPGVGDWTAQVIAMRTLACRDAWPASDIGLMLALGSRDAKQLSALAEAWRPWRSYAVMRLWHALEEAAPTAQALKAAA